MIIGTAGHIDHGKTLLIKALTGVETDRLKEEKARGITIELGFAYVPLPGGGMLGFVDVPGHERFVHTMLAGAAGIDFVLLVIAATDGVMPQTREHLQVIDLLGIRDGVVVLNKIDLVDEARLLEVEAEIEEALVGTVLAGAEILRVSAATGTGIAGLKTRLIEEAESRPEQAAAGTFRMPIDRSFTLAGSGTVVTGTVVSGTVKMGDRVMVLPQGLEARVRSIHAHNRASDTGHAGQRCALNLAGPNISKDAITRGDWLLDPSQTLVSARFDAQLSSHASEAKPIKQWTPVHLHIGTSDEMARVVLLDADELAPGGIAHVQIVPHRSLPVRHGDRLVIRDASAQRTMGGGMVLDPRAPGRRRKTPERLALLEALQHREADIALEALLSLVPGIVDLKAFAEERALNTAEIAVLTSRDDLMLLGGSTSGTETTASHVTTPPAWERLESAIKSALAAFHKDNPHLPGMPPDKLRLALRHAAKLTLMKEAFAAMLPVLAAGGSIVAQGNWIRLPTHASALAEADTRLWDRIRPLIEAERMRPPTAREMAEHIGQPVAKVRTLCKSLARMGELSEIAADRFFFPAVVTEMAEIAQRLGTESEVKTFTAAQFKDAAGCGRNVGIQVLEYFDRRGYTLRQGDVRRVVKAPAVVFPSRVK
jgi:selenocysteine-specific elongation factor